MPELDKVRKRQQPIIIALLALPFVILFLYLLPVPISGQVVDTQTGEPLAQVPVVLENGDQQITDAQGQFTARAMRFARPETTIDAEGYQPWQGQARFPVVPLVPASLDASLQPTRLQGRVVDAISGQAVANADLIAAGLRTTSAADGSFELSRLPRQPLQLTVEADGYLVQQAEVEGWAYDGSQPVDVMLLPNGLHGTVSENPSSQPIAGAVVEFGGRRSEADGDGFYYLPAATSSGELRVSAPGYLPVSVNLSSPKVLSGLEAQDVTMAPTALAGRVSDGRTGEPLPGVALSVAGQTTTTDQDGAYRLEGLHGDSLVLAAELDGYELAQEPVDQTEHLLSGQALNLELLPYHVGGQVVNQLTGSPVAGATVSAGDETTTTDAQGRFMLWDTEPPTPVAISAVGFSNATVDYQDRSKQTISLDPNTLVVTAKDHSSGQALSGVVLTGPRSQATTDAQGVALLPEVASGDVLTATLDGYATVAMTYDGAEQMEAALWLDTMAGQVVDAVTGQPVMGATIYLYDRQQCQGEACRGTLPAAWVDARADGTFETDGLTLDPIAMVKAPGYGLFFADELAPGDCGQPLCLTARLEPFEARGFYVPFHYLYNRGLLEQRLDLIAESPNLNAVVVDMKSDFGEIAWETSNALAQELGVHVEDIVQAEEVVQMCQERGIYCIARFVTFKDDPLAKGRPEWSARKKSDPDRVWLDGENLAWVDPYRKEVREYEIELAKELAALGFDELQFDYFRFTGQDHTQFIYQEDSTPENRREAITSFSRELMAALKPYGVFTAIDVFGSIILVGQEPLIGQNLQDMAQGLDYLSPMIYPQVWWPGTFPPYEEPVFYPYEVIYDSVTKVREIVPMPTRIRPWLQGYPKNYRPHGYDYRAPEMLIQRQAAEDGAAEGWLFWSGGGNFPNEIFGPMPPLDDLRSQVAANQAGYR